MIFDKSNISETVNERGKRKERDYYDLIMANTAPGLYTKYQVDLFSVPSEILEKSKIDLEKEIDEINKTLIKKQSQLNDIMNELHTRRLN